MIGWIALIALDEHDTGELETKVAENQFDFGFTFVPYPRPDIEHLKIAIVTLRSFHRNGAFDHAEPDVIPYVTPSTAMKDNALSLRIRDGWNYQVPRRVVFRANTLAIALEMVRSGKCAIYAPSFAVEALNAGYVASEKLVEIPLSSQRRAAEVSRRDVFLVKRRGIVESRIARRVSRVVRGVCGS